MTLEFKRTQGSAPEGVHHFQRDLTLHIAGYASLFNQTDLSGDVVRPGAFSASLLSPLGKIPMLFGHETHDPIGVWDRIFEDKTGLFVSGRIFAGTARANRTQRLISEGALSGLSIGYRVKRAVRRQTSSTSHAGRDLFELDLWEVSVVAFPMLRLARITQFSNISFNPNFTQEQSA